MTTFEWTMVSISAAGFFVTVGGVIGACVWAVAKVRQSTIEHIADERAQRTVAIQHAMAKFDETQDEQNHNFGEVGLSLRRFIEQIETKVHEVEIWGRDNYALKHDVADVRKDIKEMRMEIVTDIKELGRKIDSK
ncbi:MAG TPA: hypothetical protein VIM11_26705 [Tepidisphaeraceae bacterium]|jgi:uncharacterized membrane protein